MEKKKTVKKVQLKSLKKKFHLGLDETMADKLKAFCDQHGLPLSDFIRSAIAEKFDRLEAARKIEVLRGDSQ